MMTTGPDLFLLEPVFRNEVWGHMTQPVAEGNERAVCQAMQAVGWKGEVEKDPF